MSHPLRTPPWRRPIPEPAHPTFRHRLIAVPAIKAAPLPGIVSVVCACESGYFETEGHWPSSQSRRVQCDECHGSGRLTFYVGTVAGELCGYCPERQQVGTFASHEDAMQGVFCNSNPVYRTDLHLLLELGVPLAEAQEVCR